MYPQVAGGGCEGGCAVMKRAETIVLLLIARKNELKPLSGSVYFNLPTSGRNWLGLNDCNY